MVGVVFLLAAAIRLALLAWRGPATSPDSDDYLILARNLLTYGTLSLDLTVPPAPSIRFPPLYSAFIAALSWTGTTSPLVVATFQSILDAATAVILLLMARTLVPLKWAFLVALAYSLHPGVIASSRAILAETLFTAILVCAVWTLSLSLKRDRLRMTALSGIIFGVAILCRPVVLLLPLALFGVILLLLRPRRAISHGLVLVGMAFLVVTPWSIRSSRVAGRFVTVQDFTVVAGLFYTATRWDWDQKDQSWLWPHYTEELGGLLAAAEAERSTNAKVGEEEIRADRVLFREGIRNIRENPGKYLVSRARSVPYLVITSYDTFTGIHQPYETLLAERDVPRLAVKLFLLSAFSLVPFLLGIVGLPSSRESTTAALCALVWLYMLVFYLPLWVEPRYWVPATPFLLVSATLGANRLRQRFGGRAGAAT
jgi:4-amino-4-deoxy-L-arabinose transferase-like glycosyltransferase